MTEMQCPFCGCHVFYVKDPEDEYEIHEFDCLKGEINFRNAAGGTSRPDIDEKTEIYCNQCAWHGQVPDSRKV